MAEPVETSSSNRPELAPNLRLTAIVLRETFLIILLLLSLRVSKPQNESILAAYETLGDLVRLALGGGVAVWIIWHLFRLPKERGAHRAWLYIGSFGIPLALLTGYAIW